MMITRFTLLLAAVCAASVSAFAPSLGMFLVKTVIRLVALVGDSPES